MTYFLGVLFAALGVSCSIAAHEAGHLIAAKAFGVKVTQYMVGFGPTIWSHTRGETEYGLKCVPLGGYTRMIGMFPPKPGDEGVAGGGRLTQLIDRARKESNEHVGVGDENRVFYKLSAPKKITVLAAGPAMNLIIAVGILTGIVTLYGTSEMTTRISSVPSCASGGGAGGPGAAQTCAPGAGASPAQAAGILAGDRIVSMSGKTVTSWDDVRSAIAAAGGQQILVGVNRDGKLLNLTATPLLTDIPRTGAGGVPLLDGEGKPLLHRAGFLGLTPTAELVKAPPSFVATLIGNQITGTASVVAQIPAKMVGVAQAAFGGTRDPNGPMSVVGVGRIAGEVADGQLLGAHAPVSAQLAALSSLVASLNIALFVFNLIPLLPLDGGHAAAAAWEGIRRQGAKLRRRPNPGYVDVAKALPVAYVMTIALIWMSVLLIYADVVNPVKLNG